MSEACDVQGEAEEAGGIYSEEAWKDRILLMPLAIEMVGPDSSLRSRVKGRVAKESLTLRKILSRY